ncbi:MAG TPA: glycoside hydrolase [Actinophytocola sp.]|uniref:glycoside hydrolase family 30 protein n=1 Tax=Actinophytocola sp. TaxID=1872138 RepID=UPI002DBE6609|nr:glycoside hydrolase [Actinophytocola sp.]HEU5472259.1 glycoside hydrolase [Actinophytocola sp.]
MSGRRLLRLAVAALGAVALTGVTPAAATHGAAGRIDFGDRLQSIDGFGFAQAFQRAAAMNGLFGLPPENQRAVLDLLLSRENGAGLSILRLGIGSSPQAPYDLMRSIQPVDPGGPAAPPRYEWDGYDGGQVWLAKEAKAYGVRRFFADAWSAPGYMKTNGDDRNGGMLCGLPGTSCASGDWRQAYADYLAQYARFYAREGIRITDLGFTNEPDFTATYASMRFDGPQIVDFVKVLGPTLARSGLPARLVCCDGAGWTEQEVLSTAIEADPAARRLVTVHTGHPYKNPANRPLPTGRPVWMTEWQPNGNTWNEAWDDGSGWAGITVAENIHDTLTLAGASAYVYWFGASLGATRAFIQLDGANYHVSKRLWAMAAYSRFIRPDADRVAAASTAPGVKVSAFRNADGSKVIEILNTNTTATRTDFALREASRSHRAAVYLTDETHSLSRTGTLSVRDRRLAVELAPRSLTTVVISR